MSSNINDIQHHISRISQIRSITNAMYLLSMGRLQKERPRLEHSNEYMHHLNHMMTHMLFSAEAKDCKDRYLTLDTSGTALYLAVTSDKGLCAGYNQNVVSLCAKEMSEKENETKQRPLLFCLGKRGTKFFQKKNIVPEKELPGSSFTADTVSAMELSKLLIDMYVTSYVNEVYIVYTPFTVGELKPKCVKLLPLQFDEIHTDEPSEPFEIGFEPNAVEVMEEFIPSYCAGVLFNIMLNASVAENAARRNAMNTAMDSADELIQKLGVELNTQRQLAITQEVSEISAAAELKKKGI